MPNLSDQDWRPVLLVKVSREPFTGTRFGVHVSRIRVQSRSSGAAIRGNSCDDCRGRIVFATPFLPDLQQRDPVGVCEAALASFSARRLMPNKLARSIKMFTNSTKRSEKMRGDNQ